MSYYIRVHGADVKKAVQDTKESFAAFVKRAAPEHKADEAVITDTTERMIGILPELAHGQEYSIILSGSYTYGDNLDSKRITGIKANVDVEIVGERSVSMFTMASAIHSFPSNGNTMVSGFGPMNHTYIAKDLAEVQQMVKDGKVKPGQCVELEDGNLVTAVDPDIEIEDSTTDAEIPPLIERIKRRMGAYMGKQ